jgi:hypothetical protein
VTITALGLAACGPRDPTDTDASTGEDTAGSTGAPAPSTGEDPTTGDVPDTTDGSDSVAATTSDPPDTTGEPPGTTTGETGDTTGGDDVCTLEHQACTLAGQLGEFEDCGVVDPWDSPVADWEAAQACALTAAGKQRAFKLITILQGIDSDVGQAFVGQAARSYQVSALFFDSDPCGGGGCGPVVSSSSCSGLAATEGCTVEPGNICLTCADQGDSSELCAPL